MSTTEITLEEADAIARKLGEGFYPHPSDLRKFFRLATMDGEMKRFDFECGPGTVFHPELHLAVHPWQMPGGYTLQGHWSALKRASDAK